MLKMSVLLFLIFLYIPCPVFAAHGVSIDNSLKYPQDFIQFDYTSPHAERGGKLVLHDIGSFDKMNPFTRRGSAPYGLEMLVFEPLAVASLDEPFAVYGLIAEDIELAADKMSVTFTLNKNAKFSDVLVVIIVRSVFNVFSVKSLSSILLVVICTLSKCKPISSIFERYPLPSSFLKSFIKLLSSDFNASPVSFISFSTTLTIRGDEISLNSGLTLTP